MSKVVFVGNVPYNMGEDQLIDVFKSVGQVVGFRLVFDRDTGKAKGYGFCEFSDHETALSAVRNLNNTEVGGRPLRIDLADSDPFLEGKTTVRGEILDSGYPGPAEPRSAWRTAEAFMANLPAGRPLPKNVAALDAISTTLAGMQPTQLLEVLAQMKAFIITHPEQARILLQKQPQLSYALFQALLLHKIVPTEVLLKMRDASTAPTPAGGMQDAKRHPPTPLLGPRTPVPPPAHMQPPPPLHGYAQPPYHQPPYAQQPPPQVPPVAQSYYRPPPPAMPPPPVSAPAPVQTPEISEQQRDMIMQVLSLSPGALDHLPPDQKATIMQLRSQFMGGT
ncbi:hypothetical protein MD484_g5832, partial [Candolleomyces efflorescens]